MVILTSVRRLYISFKSLVNDFVYSFGRAALLLLVEVQNRTVPVQERRRIRVKLLPRNSGLQPLYTNLCTNLIYCIDLVEDIVQTRAVDTVVNFVFHEITKFADELSAANFHGEERYVYYFNEAIIFRSYNFVNVVITCNMKSKFEGRRSACCV